MGTSREVHDCRSVDLLGDPVRLLRRCGRETDDQHRVGSVGFRFGDVAIDFDVGSKDFRGKRQLHPDPLAHGADLRGELLLLSSVSELVTGIGMPMMLLPAGFRLTLIADLRQRVQEYHLHRGGRLGTLTGRHGSRLGTGGETSQRRRQERDCQRAANELTTRQTLGT